MIRQSNILNIHQTFSINMLIISLEQDVGTIRT